MNFEETEKLRERIEQNATELPRETLEQYYMEAMDLVRDGKRIFDEENHKKCFLARAVFRLCDIITEASGDKGFVADRLARLIVIAETMSGLDAKDEVREMKQIEERNNDRTDVERGTDWSGG